MLRRLVRWGAIAVACVLVAPWHYSTSHYVYFVTASSCWGGLGAGQISFGYDGNDAGRARWQWRDTTERLRWGFRWVHRPGYLITAVPFWCPVGAALALSASTWWTEAKGRRAGRVCMECGYDRAGIPRDALCPECGRPR